MVAVLILYKSKATQQTSGLLVYNITKGNGPKPRTGATVKLNYEGYFTDGKLFGSNVKTVDEKCGTYDIRKEQQGAIQRNANENRSRSTNDSWFQRRRV